MRLIIKEYIAQMKEKDELDLLLCDVLGQQGYIADNKPKTGNRQYGVDIQLHNKKELLLLVVKQGNIDRQVWSGNQNSVRQSLEEIRDVYLGLLTDDELSKNIRIIVATNGIKDEAIRPNWNGYVKNNRTWFGKQIEIQFWGIDQIVEMVQKYFLNEYLFDPKLQSTLRKALYYVEENDYKRIYYEKIVDSLIEKMQNAKGEKAFQRNITSLYLASQMICQYAVESGVITIAVMVSEYLLIRYWKFLLCNNYFEKKKYIEWLVKFCKCYDKWNALYYQKVKVICKDEELFPNYNLVENKIMLYEILGYMVSYAGFLIMYDKARAMEVINSIVLLLNNNPRFAYAPYDIHVGTIVALYRVLAKFNRYEDIKTLLNYQVVELMLHFRSNHKYPAQSDSFEEAVNIEFGFEENPYEMSVFWGLMLECIVCMDENELYDNIKSFLKEELSGVTKSTWFLRKSEEELFYDYSAMSLSGEGVVIDTENDYELLKKKILFIFEQYNDEVFSFDEYSFEELELIICRYYGYLPRINHKLINRKSEK